MGDFAERYLGSGRRHHQYATKRVQIIPIICEIANVYGVTLAAFDGGSDILAAHTRTYGTLNVSDGQAISRGNSAVDIDVYVESLGDSFRENAARASNRTEYLFYLRPIC